MLNEVLFEPFHRRETSLVDARLQTHVGLRVSILGQLRHIKAGDGSMQRRLDMRRGVGDHVVQLFVQNRNQVRARRVEQIGHHQMNHILGVAATLNIEEPILCISIKLVDVHAGATRKRGQHGVVETIGNGFRRGAFVGSRRNAAGTIGILFRILGAVVKVRCNVTEHGRGLARAKARQIRARVGVNRLLDGGIERAHQLLRGEIINLVHSDRDHVLTNQLAHTLINSRENFI